MYKHYLGLDIRNDFHFSTSISFSNTYCFILLRIKISLDMRMNRGSLQ